jgi:hypothetical protein
VREGNEEIRGRGKEEVPKTRLDVGEEEVWNWGHGGSCHFREYFWPFARSTE